MTTEILNGKRKMMIFDMDNTILQQSFIHTAARQFGFYDELNAIVAEKLDDVPRTRKIALLMKGRTRQEITSVVAGIPMVEDALEVMNGLRAKGYTIGIISDSYDCVTGYVSEQLSMDFSCSNELVFAMGVTTGEVVIPQAFLHQPGSICSHIYCKTNVMHHVMGVYGFTIDQVVAVGDGPNDVCMISKAGHGVAFNPRTALLTEVADQELNQQSFRPLLELGR